MFLRRVWKEIHPGHDTIADAVFLYPQVSGTSYSCQFVMDAFGLLSCTILHI